MQPFHDVTAVVLAGGLARRMGGEDKGLVMLNGAPLVAYALAALEPQAGCIMINANRNVERYANLGHAVIADRQPGFNGPLAGMASALALMQTRYLVTVPCDCPLLPGDLVQRLLAARAREDAELAVAHDGTRMQPVFALLQRSLLPSLERFLAADGRKIDQWYAGHRLALADFSDQPDAFSNVNTPQELAHMSHKLDRARPGLAQPGPGPA